MLPVRATWFLRKVSKILEVYPSLYSLPQIKGHKKSTCVLDSMDLDWTWCSPVTVFLYLEAFTAISYALELLLRKKGWSTASTKALCALVIRGASFFCFMTGLLLRHIMHWYTYRFQMRSSHLEELRKYPAWFCSLHAPKVTDRIVSNRGDHTTGD